MLTWKLRISVLWISLAVCQSASVALLLLEPGVIRDLMAGEVLGVDVRSARTQIYTALIWLVPMAMAYATLVLKDAPNRRINGLLGAGGALNGIAEATQQSGTSIGGHIFEVVGILVSLLIFWHAWKWPRSSEVPMPRSDREAQRAQSPERQ